MGMIFGELGLSSLSDASELSSSPLIALLIAVEPDFTKQRPDSHVVVQEDGVCLDCDARVQAFLDAGFWTGRHWK